MHPFIRVFVVMVSLHANRTPTNTESDLIVNQWRRTHCTMSSTISLDDGPGLYEKAKSKSDESKNESVCKPANSIRP